MKGITYMKRIAKWSMPRVILGAVLSVAAVSLAFFATTTFDSTAEHSAKAGAAEKLSHPLPLTVSFPEGVTPTHQVPVEILVTNDTAKPVELAGPELTLTVPSDPICSQWVEVWVENEDGSENAGMPRRFSGEVTSALVPIPAHTGPTSILNYSGGPTKQMYLRFKPSLTAGTDETSCAEQPINLVAKLTTPH